MISEICLQELNDKLDSYFPFVNLADSVITYPIATNAPFLYPLKTSENIHTFITEYGYVDSNFKSYENMQSENSIYSKNLVEY